jgi:hypothetical protein
VLHPRRTPSCREPNEQKQSRDKDHGRRRDRPSQSNLLCRGVSALASRTLLLLDCTRGVPICARHHILTTAPHPPHFVWSGLQIIGGTSSTDDDGGPVQRTSSDISGGVAHSPERARTIHQQLDLAESEISSVHMSRHEVADVSEAGVYHPENPSEHGTERRGRSLPRDPETGGGARVAGARGSPSSHGDDQKISDVYMDYGAQQMRAILTGSSAARRGQHGSPAPVLKREPPNALVDGNFPDKGNLIGVATTDEIMVRQRASSESTRRALPRPPRRSSASKPHRSQTYAAGVAGPTNGTASPELVRNSDNAGVAPTAAARSSDSAGVAMEGSRRPSSIVVSAGLEEDFVFPAAVDTESPDGGVTGGSSASPLADSKTPLVGGIAHDDRNDDEDPAQSVLASAAHGSAQQTDPDLLAGVNGAPTTVARESSVSFDAQSLPSPDLLRGRIVEESEVDNPDLIRTMSRHTSRTSGFFSRDMGVRLSMQTMLPYENASEKTSKEVKERAEEKFGEQNFGTVEFDNFNKAWWIRVKSSLVVDQVCLPPFRLTSC